MWKDIGKNPVLDVEFLDKNGVPIVPGVMISYKSKIRGRYNYRENVYIPGKTITKTVLVKELLLRLRMKPKRGYEIMKCLLVYDKRNYNTFRIHRYDLTEVTKYY